MRLRLELSRSPLEEGDQLLPVPDRPSASLEGMDDLYRTERAGLLRFVARRTAMDRAEDIVQQVFSRLASKSGGEIAAIKSPGAYLRQAARNLVRDEARAAARHNEHHHVSIDDVDVSGGDPIAYMEARDRLTRIEQAVLHLKPLSRQIFLACRLDGYSYAEIAEQTGLSVRGVEKQMSRAIKQLGRHLRRHD